MACKAEAPLPTSWNSCPTDILLLIFKKMNCSSLEKCFHINRSWREASIYYCDHHNLWPQMVVKCLRNKGESYITRSKQNLRDMFITSQLWSEVAMSDSVVKEYPKSDVIKKIHVYGDKLIVVCESKVKILDVETFNLIRLINVKCEDYQETDHLVVIIQEKKIKNSKLILNVSKKAPCDCLEANVVHNFPKANLYSVKDKMCIFFDSCFTLWAFVDGCRRHLRILGRYYNSFDLVHSFTVELPGIYILLLNGNVLFVDYTEMSIRLLYSISLPSDLHLNTTVAFDRHTVVCKSAKKDKPRIFENHAHQINMLVLPQISSALLHGDIVLLGFRNGMAGACILSTLTTDKDAPELQFCIKSTDKQPVRDIEVYEGKLAHKIFLLIGNKIAQVNLTYPGITEGA